MLPRIPLFGISLTSYGLMIAVGLAAANLIALFETRRHGDDIYSFIILEAYGLLLGFAGAKALYIALFFGGGGTLRLSDAAYMSGLMRGGFVFFGGLAAGLLGVFLAGKLHRINAAGYLKKYVFLIPFAHGFGRLGCFCAGCCYGIQYHGAFSVTFGAGSLAPAGVPLFPVQLLEAAVLFALAAALFVLCRRGSAHTLSAYFICYGAARFLLEFLRGDARGGFLALSTSQWIGLLLLAVGLVVAARSGPRISRPLREK